MLAGCVGNLLARGFMEQNWIAAVESHRANIDRLFWAAACRWLRDVSSAAHRARDEMYSD